MSCRGENKPRQSDSKRFMISKLCENATAGLRRLPLTAVKMASAFKRPIDAKLNS